MRLIFTTQFHGNPATVKALEFLLKQISPSIIILIISKLMGKDGRRKVVSGVHFSPHIVFFLSFNSLAWARMWKLLFPPSGLTAAFVPAEEREAPSVMLSSSASPRTHHILRIWRVWSDASLAVYPQRYSALMGFMPKQSLEINTRTLLSSISSYFRARCPPLLGLTVASPAITARPDFLFPLASVPATRRGTRKGLLKHRVTRRRRHALDLRLAWPLSFPDELRLRAIIHLRGTAWSTWGHRGDKLLPTRWLCSSPRSPPPAFSEVSEHLKTCCFSPTRWFNSRSLAHLYEFLKMIGSVCKSY